VEGESVDDFEEVFFLAEAASPFRFESLALAGVAAGLLDVEFDATSRRSVWQPAKKSINARQELAHLSFVIFRVVSAITVSDEQRVFRIQPQAVPWEPKFPVRTLRRLNLWLPKARGEYETNLQKIQCSGRKLLARETRGGGAEKPGVSSV
jgi:hypothetical protein